MKISTAEDVMVTAQKIAALTQVVRFLRAAQKGADTGIQCHLQLADQHQTRTIVNSNTLINTLATVADELQAELTEAGVDLDNLLAQEEEGFNRLYN